MSPFFCQPNGRGLADRLAGINCITAGIGRARTWGAEPRRRSFGALEDNQQPDQATGCSVTSAGVIANFAGLTHGERFENIGPRVNPVGTQPSSSVLQATGGPSPSDGSQPCTLNEPFAMFLERGFRELIPSQRLALRPSRRAATERRSPALIASPGPRAGLFRPQIGEAKCCVWMSPDLPKRPTCVASERSPTLVAPRRPSSCE